LFYKTSKPFLSYYFSEKMSFLKRGIDFVILGLDGKGLTLKAKLESLAPTIKKIILYIYK